MRTLTLFVMLIFSVLVSAEPLRLKVTPINGQQVISYVKDEWYFVAKESNYNVYIAKGELEESNGMLIIQSMTEFDNYETYSYMEKPVKRIFSYGALSCEQKKMYLLGSMYSADDNTVQFVQYHDFGEWISELDRNGTARNEVWKIVCNKSV